MTDLFEDDRLVVMLSEQSPSLQACFCELADYMNEFSLGGVFQVFENIKPFSKLSLGMVLNSDTLRSLEIFKNLTNGTEQGTLIWLLDHTNTGFGSRLLKQWIARPLMDREEIMKRTDALESIINNQKGLVIERLTRIMQSCPDLEIWLNRIHYQRSKRKEVYLFLKKIEEIFDSILGLREDVVNDTLDSHYLKDMIWSTRNLIQDQLREFRTFFPMIYSPAAMDEKADNHASSYFNTKFFGYDKIQERLDEIDHLDNRLKKELIEIRKLKDSQKIGPRSMELQM
ncbi:unnamed protein product [Ambrosiozyma monospora]|uniref:Unnamed protein product n=1 Tax=Ambrosiozyma monospora TaxID=43982 RepID=A0ACB5THG5_AMBMO|nr:unnamed protein product [Ambrosiozyma monospora]